MSTYYEFIKDLKLLDPKYIKEKWKSLSRVQLFATLWTDS